jgi:light-harvesting complex I chlorophyll a/b binding protein 1
VGQGFWEPLVLAIGIAEAYRVALAWDTPTGAGFNAIKDEYVMGEIGFDPLNFLAEKTPEEVLALKNKELNNGRLAMIAVAGFVAQEFVNNTEIFQHLLRQ